MNANDLWALAPSVLRLGAGLRVRSTPTRPPEQPLELYEFEVCPFCRKAREALNELDLAFVSRPCPKGEVRKRAWVEARGGQAQFPYLVDPNTETEIYESEAIADYLAETYGDGRSAARRTLAPLRTLSSNLASASRPLGGRVRPEHADRTQPTELLRLYGFEASPYCRKVRERLHVLNLDFLSLNVAKGSARRPELAERGGKVQVPYLVDPNTGAELYESEDILAYLEATYA